MLLVFDPDRRIQMSTELIARDLGISTREAEIAALLVAGHDINAIAERLKISIHTARTHVKAVFSKTGARSQSELIQRIAAGPASVKGMGALISRDWVEQHRSRIDDSTEVGEISRREAKAVPEYTIWVIRKSASCRVICPRVFQEKKQGSLYAETGLVCANPPPVDLR
jgi:DNA-binding CsgD family transcriptional regulator